MAPSFDEFCYVLRAEAEEIPDPHAAQTWFLARRMISNPPIRDFENSSNLLGGQQGFKLSDPSRHHGLFPHRQDTTVRLVLSLVHSDIAPALLGCSLSTEALSRERLDFFLTIIATPISAPQFPQMYHSARRVS